MTNPKVVTVSLAAEHADDRSRRLQAIAEQLEIDPARIVAHKLVRKSLDARQRNVIAQLKFEVGIDGPLPPPEPVAVAFPSVTNSTRRVVIVGCGPAGMFAAIRSLELGRRPIIVERGKDVSARHFDLAPIMRQGVVLEDSNYCFGEGGAGTFSDGKLYTRANKRGPVSAIYRILRAHGAPERILTDAHPHIGSNLLPGVIKSLRTSILEAGGEIRFQTRVTDLVVQQKNVKGVVTCQGTEILGDAVILATGHSARDIYRLLVRKGIALQPKPFAVGVRIEHPQSLIDRLQYRCLGNGKRPGYLPAASYSLTATVNDRSVYSFCVCPGGFVIPSATANDEVVVNGMSLSKRDSVFSNGGMVVTVHPEDAKILSPDQGTLSGVAFQKQLEHKAKQAGGQGQKAPAQRLTDFLTERDSKDLPPTSYFPGVTPFRIDRLLPSWLAQSLRQGLLQIGGKKRGFVSEEALMIGFETRTSAPVRIPRDASTLQHPDWQGLFPCGEGAGYAGGIVSAALDGFNCAEAAVGNQP